MTKTSQLSFRRFAIMSMFCIVFSVFGSNSQAGLFAPDACDPQYYESLESRAWLEAQREITQNQNLIFKSDSVLEYTCFDSYLRELADHASDMFSETNRWGGPPGNMASSLTNLVGTPLSNYDTSNFNHNLLGGRSPAPYPLNGSVSAGTYACNTMNQVWQLAKCMDFIDQASYSAGAASNFDGFFTFAEYAADPDKRFLPTACSPKTADFQSNIDRALTDDAASSSSGQFTAWEEDPVNTYYNLIHPPGSSASSPSCGTTQSIIPTGLTVYRTSGGSGSYAEHVCVIPGCYYEPPSGGGSATGRCCLHNNSSVCSTP